MYTTDQENFWAGEFGDDYISRNTGERLLSSKTALFSKILSATRNVTSVMELGCNIGLNLQAIQRMKPDVRLYGVEINKKAVQQARQIPNATIFHDSIIGFAAEHQASLTFTAGVLIHIHPDMLNQVYQTLYDGASTYILVYEYYNPTPMEISYRGHGKKLFKRDFAGEILDLYPDLELIDYGFVWRRDPNFPDDDLNWFLMQKTKPL